MLPKTKTQTRPEPPPGPQLLDLEVASLVGQVLAQYVAGTRLTDIYSQFSITESTLGRWRRDAGIPTRP